ncbi:hypothetical protein J3D54_005376 [Pseudomonas sp. GGS8]|uniref:hypothetical protein n=1 Tax=Pseudomonas sp. GGS8 TaxID=2817892 RepID=UPI0020A1AC59|nr:hypothetical protein [Pseudomonas sp. GGS8]MCP1446244.1 hypothetical protein [Pseudomonas sp. GGS8]
MTIKSKDWYAWLNTMPPKPDDFHVVGDVEVANPGIVAVLTRRSPKGSDQKALMLDLHLVQQPGKWIQQISWTQAKYDQVMPPNSPIYTTVEIFYEGERIAFIEEIGRVS